MLEAEEDFRCTVIAREIGMPAALHLDPALPKTPKQDIIRDCCKKKCVKLSVRSRCSKLGNKFTIFPAKNAKCLLSGKCHQPSVLSPQKVASEMLRSLCLIPIYLSASKGSASCLEFPEVSWIRYASKLSTTELLPCSTKGKDAQCNTLLPKSRSLR